MRPITVLLGCFHGSASGFLIEVEIHFFLIIDVEFMCIQQSPSEAN